MKTRQKRFKLQITQNFSEDFKRSICEHYLAGNFNKEQIRIEFGIKGKSSLLNLLRKFGYAISQIKTNQELPLWQSQKKRHL